MLPNPRGVSFVFFTNGSIQDSERLSMVSAIASATSVGNAVGPLVVPVTGHAVLAVSWVSAIAFFGLRQHSVSLTARN
jgi:hypothetical protein